MTSALRWGVGGQHHAPAALPPGKTRYPLYRSLGRPQGRSGRVREISTSPGFDPRTVQPVASRYTDWAIPAHIIQVSPENPRIMHCSNTQQLPFNIHNHVTTRHCKTRTRVLRKASLESQVPTKRTTRQGKKLTAPQNFCGIYFNK